MDRVSERVERSAESIWKHRFVTYLLLCTSCCLSIWIWFSPQLPGVAAVVLGGIAAIMTFRDMHHTHKLLFTGAVLVLMFLEFRDIRVDRINSDRQALDDRKKQDVEFRSVRDKQEDSFRQIAQGFELAISGIDSAVNSARATLRQTRPYALVQFSGGFSILNAPSPPAPFSAGVEYVFNYEFVNDGIDSAKIYRELAQVYIGKPDDKDTQLSLAEKFQSEWDDTPRSKEPGNYVAHYKGFNSQRHTFTNEELNRINGGDTVYVLRRIEYSDRIGRWLSQRCDHLQVEKGSINIVVNHLCVVFCGFRAMPISVPN